MQWRSVGKVAITKESGFASDLTLLVRQELLVPFVGRKTNGHLWDDSRYNGA